MKYLLWGCLALSLTAGQATGKIITKTVEYEQAGVSFRSYLAYDDATQGRRPGVLVFPEWWGVEDFARQKAEDLAKMGYVALAADMYGQGRTTDDPQQAAKLAGGVSAEQMRSRARAALEALREQDMVRADRIAAIGFCFGGNVALQLAYSGADIQAAVSFHGNMTPPSAEEAKRIRAHLLVCTGAADPMVPQEKVQAFWKALEAAPVTWQVNIYSGAKHSFMNPAADQRNMKGVGYDAFAAERAWEAMQMLFRHVLVRPNATTQPRAE